MTPVAPLVGAWIETCKTSCIYIRTIQSLPSWERGLKHACMLAQMHKRESLPSWERGLKHWRTSSRTKSNCVAPLVGAWIETERVDIIQKFLKVAPLVGAWIETSVVKPPHKMAICRSPRGSVD